jgi:hypothetical protein
VLEVVRCDTCALVSERTCTVIDRVCCRAVNCRKWSHNLREVTGYNVDKVSNYVGRYALWEKVRIDISNFSTADCEYVKVTLVAFSVEVA